MRAGGGATGAAPPNPAKRGERSEASLALAPHPRHFVSPQGPVKQRWSGLRVRTPRCAFGAGPAFPCWWS